MSAAHINLSLLSRGVGEVQQNGHEKIEVKLEPEDYNNWLDDPRREWHLPAVIPPIRSNSPAGVRDTHVPPPTQAFTSDFNSPRTYASTYDLTHSEVYLPKTFTTRKGALLLFSEDFACKQRNRLKHKRLHAENTSSVPQLNTVDDLAKSILAYGAAKSFSFNSEEESQGNSIYLGFTHSKSRKYYERQFKPGFSAKRYLASWSRLWDYSLFNKISSKGMIKQSTYKTKSDYDVSGIPLPYRILRQWLFAPGTLDGYSFYRQASTAQAMIREESTFILQEQRPTTEESQLSKGSIKVASLIGNTELVYGELDSGTKESILTELLVKSAITHAIKKQKEFEAAMVKHAEDDEEAKRKASTKLYEFDMMQAIETALDSSILPGVATHNLDAQGLIPPNAVKKPHKKGFTGTKGFGLRLSDTSSLSSITSADSLVDRRQGIYSPHTVIPPIGAYSDQQSLSYRDGQSMAKALSESALQDNTTRSIKSISHTITIPGASIIHDSQPQKGGLTINIEPPTPQHTMLGFKGYKPSPSPSNQSRRGLHENDEVHSSWRQSVASNGDKLATSSLDKSKKSTSLQSLNKINLDDNKLNGNIKEAYRTKEFDIDVLSNITSNTSLGSSTPRVPKALYQSVQRQAKSADTAVRVTVDQPATEVGTQDDIGVPDTKPQLLESHDTANHTSRVKSSAAVNGHFSQAYDELNQYAEQMKSYSAPLANLRMRQQSQDQANPTDRNQNEAVMDKTAEDKAKSEDKEESEVKETTDRKDSASTKQSQDGGVTLADDVGEAHVSHINLIQQAGLETENEFDDKRSMMSMMSYMSKRSRVSAVTQDSSNIPYSKGITARQDPFSALQVNTLSTGGDFDHTAAITSWRYQVEQEEPYSKLHQTIELESKPSEEPLQQTPSARSSSKKPTPIQQEETSSSASLYSVPAANMEGYTPSPIKVPRHEVEEESRTEDAEEEVKSQISERELLEALTEQAREIAKKVLGDNADAGVDLAADAKKAAELLMNNLPSRLESGMSKSSSQERDSVKEAGGDEETGADEPDQDTWGGGGADRSDNGTTVGQLIKDGMEELVHKIDEYVVEEKSKRSSSKASSMESEATLVEDSTQYLANEEQQQQELELAASTSIPDASAYTPSIVISGHSTQQEETNGEGVHGSGNLSRLSVPSADGQQADSVGVIPSESSHLSSASQNSDSLLGPSLHTCPDSDIHVYGIPRLPSAQNKLLSINIDKIEKDDRRDTESTSTPYKISPIKITSTNTDGSHQATPSAAADMSLENQSGKLVSTASNSARSMASLKTATPSQAEIGKSSAGVLDVPLEQQQQQTEVDKKERKSADTVSPGKGSAKSKSSGKSKKSTGPVVHETEFVVGKVPEKNELKELLAPIDTTPTKGKTTSTKDNRVNKKGKTAASKPPPQKKEPVKKAVATKKAPATKKPAQQKSKKPAKAKSPVKSDEVAEPQPSEDDHTPPASEEVEVVEEWKTPEPEEEADMEFVIVRDEFPDDDEEDDVEDIPKPALGSVKSLQFHSSPEGTQTANSDDDDGLHGVSNKEAQAAKRAAAKEKRKREMERRRKEREEAQRKEKEDAERRERIRQQMEDERLKREEELRLKKEREREEQERIEREELAKIKAEMEAKEREKRKAEEMARYMEEKRKKALEEEAKRKELAALKAAEEAERLRQEQLMLEAMAEEERIEYLRRKAEEERLRAIAEEEARIRREAEAKRIWEELQLQEAERKRAEEILRQRLMFQRSLNVEAHGLEHSHDITRAFVFSYYELLKWLGFEIPQWAQYGPTGVMKNNSQNDGDATS